MYSLYVRTSPQSSHTAQCDLPCTKSWCYQQCLHKLHFHTRNCTRLYYVPNQTVSLCIYATITVNLQFNISNITAPALYYMRTELCMKYKAQKYKMEHTNSTTNQCKTWGRDDVVIYKCTDVVISTESFTSGLKPWRVPWTLLWSAQIFSHL